MIQDPFVEWWHVHINQPETKEFITRNAIKFNISEEKMLDIYCDKVYRAYCENLMYMFLHGIDKTNEPSDHTIHYISRQIQKHFSAETHREKLVYCGGGLYRNDINLEEAINK